MACSIPTVEEVAFTAGVQDRLYKLCSVQDFEKIVEYCKQWKKIGYSLGLTRTQIEDIDKEKKTEDEKRSTMLSIWKQSRSFKATFHKLVNAIYECGCTDDAYQVCMYLATTAKDDTSTIKPIHSDFLLTKNECATKDVPINIIPCTISMPIVNNIIQPNESSRHGHARITKECLEEKFSTLTDEFENSVSSAPLADLRKTAASLPHTIRNDLKDPSNAVRCMIRAESTVEFLGELNTHGCYLRPSLLQHMVTKYGSQKCKQMMAEYQETLQIYRQTTTIKQHINKQGETRAMHRKFVELLGRDWEEKTVEDFIQHCNRQHLCDSLLRLSC